MAYAYDVTQTTSLPYLTLNDPLHHPSSSQPLLQTPASQTMLPTGIPHRKHQSHDHLFSAAPPVSPKHKKPYNKHLFRAPRLVASRLRSLRHGASRLLRRSNASSRALPSQLPPSRLPPSQLPPSQLSNPMLPSYPPLATPAPSEIPATAQTVSRRVAHDHSLERSISSDMTGTPCTPITNDLCDSEYSAHTLPHHDSVSEPSLHDHLIDVPLSPQKLIFEETANQDMSDGQVLVEEEAIIRQQNDDEQGAEVQIIDDDDEDCITGGKHSVVDKRIGDTMMGDDKMGDDKTEDVFSEQVSPTISSGSDSSGELAEIKFNETGLQTSTSHDEGENCVADVSHEKLGYGTFFIDDLVSQNTFDEGSDNSTEIEAHCDTSVAVNVGSEESEDCETDAETVKSEKENESGLSMQSVTDESTDVTASTIKVSDEGNLGVGGSETLSDDDGKQSKDEASHVPIDGMKKRSSARETGTEDGKCEDAEAKSEQDFCGGGGIGEVVASVCNCDTQRAIAARRASPWQKERAGGVGELAPIVQLFNFIGGIRIPFLDGLFSFHK